MTTVDMPTVSVHTSASEYQVIIEAGILSRCGKEIRRRFPDRSACVVVTDKNVEPLYGDTVGNSLAEHGFSPRLACIPAGEESKSFEMLESVCGGMCQTGLDRKSLLIALGGGVVGDLAGFAASIFFRGIPYVQIPTTIVAQVDSSVGGKTGINTSQGKNLIGTFHQPSLVLADPRTLRSLPVREYNEGFAEVIKHACIRDGGMFDDIAAAAASTDREGLGPLIARNVAIKAAIVAADEFETKGLRALLNFGHTIGHGIEASAGYGALLHGEAISLGLRAALILSEAHAGLSPDITARVLSLLRAFDLPLVLPGEITTEGILEKMSRDKKFEKGAIRFVLMRAPGDAFVSNEVTPVAITRAIEALRTL